MPDRKSYFTNGWQSTLPSGVSDVASSMVVADASGLAVGTYLVIDPEDPAKREYVYVGDGGKAGNTLTLTERNLAGSVGQVAHDPDAVVRQVASAQAFEDLHLRVDAAETSIAAIDPAGVYLPLAGGTMAGAIAMGNHKITGLGGPTIATDAANKDYVDTEVSSEIGTHEAAGDPHPQYLTEAEADIRYAPGTGGAYLLLSGGTMGGAINMDGNTLSAPADPTAGTHVGDRDYNDARYIQIGGVAWGDVTGKPSTFTPSSHVHSGADITSGTVPFARLPVGTGSTQVAQGNHTHTSFDSLTLTSINDRAFSMGNLHIWNETNQAPDRYWLEAPANTNFYLGPRIGGDTLLGLFLRADHTLFSGSIAVEEGSFSSPAIRPSTDPGDDTGIYFSESLNRIGFTVDDQANVVISHTTMSPIDDGSYNALDLGSSGYRWGKLWADAPSDTTSDERLKTNLVAMDDRRMLETVRRVMAVEFDRIDRDDDRHERGFIAQHVQNADPDIVHRGDDDMLGLRDRELIATLWGAVRAIDERLTRAGA